MSKLYVNEIVEANAGAGVAIPGHVIQVVNSQTDNAGWITTSSSSFVDSGVSVTITPKYTNSIIELDFRTYMAHGDYLRLTLYRGSTDLASGDYTFGFHATTTTYESATILWHDTPQTTSPITYKIYFKSHTGSNVHLTHNQSGYTFKATEVAQ